MNNPPKRQKKVSLFRTDKPAYSDSVLTANRNLDWVQRLYDRDTPTIQIPGQPYRSTHFMADDDKGYVYPTVVRKDGILKYLGDSAEDYARSTNTGIQLPKEQGDWFARGGYKQGKGVLSGFKNGGKMKSKFSKSGRPKAEDGLLTDDPYDIKPVPTKPLDLNFSNIKQPGALASPVSSLTTPDASPFADFLGNKSSSSALNGVAALSRSVPSNGIDTSSFGHSSYFSKQQSRQADLDRGTDIAASAAQAIPGVGSAIGAGLELGKAVGHATKDQYGIYKSKGAEVADNFLDVPGHLAELGDVITHPSLSGLVNFATFGSFGKNRLNEEAKKQKQISITQNMNDSIGASETAGQRASSLVGGYQAPGYGKKGIKLRTRFSK